MRTFAPFEPVPHLAIAVSGGSDSMALTILLQQWVLQHGGQLTALTVDHGLRPEAQEEAAWVHQFLTAQAIPHHTLKDTTHTITGNLQEGARDLRYRLMTDFCRHHGILHLCTGHTRNDQTETFLLRLQRGSGVDGLAAIPAQGQRNGIRLLRPLLSLPRASLRRYLRMHGWFWREDPTNENPRFARNALRQQLAEGTDTLQARYAETATAIGRSRAALAKTTAQAAVQCVRITLAGYATLNPLLFNKLSEDIALRILRSLLCCIGGQSTLPRFEKLYPLYHAILAGPPCTQTLHSCQTVWKKRPVYSPGNRRIPALPTTATPTLWDGRFEISNRISGSYIDALRQEGRLSLRPYLEASAQAHLPRQVLESLIALKKTVNGIETVLAVPHIDYYAPGFEQHSFACRFQPVYPFTPLPFGYMKTTGNPAT
ncbi:MAG: tRNA lysidine(34) synthetase TilS [Hyphomicrobiales bacterium]|nr:tRNA lysidine(34) synthetase TilS [Hyphomicrobiales bacterium]